jgi:hypothetical protein
MIHAKYQYSYKTITEKEVDKNCAVSLLLKVNQNMHGYVTLHQKHSRNYLNTNYKYEVAKVIVAAVRREEDGAYTVH